MLKQTLKLYQKAWIIFWVVLLCATIVVVIFDQFRPDELIRRFPKKRPAIHTVFLISIAVFGSLRSYFLYMIDETETLNKRLLNYRNATVIDSLLFLWVTVYLNIFFWKYVSWFYLMVPAACLLWFVLRFPTKRRLAGKLYLEREYIDELS